MDQKQAARDFVKRWENEGYEKQDKSKFWEDLLENVFEIPQPYNFIDKEKKVKVDNHNRWIDIYIPHTKVLIEHKSRNVSLDFRGDLGTAYEQARLYESELPLTEKPRWIITCNFKEFRIYDREHPQENPVCFNLEELSNYLHQIGVIVNDDIKRIAIEKKVSIEASKSIAKIYNLLLSEYKNPTDEDLESLNIFCVRLVFCMFAEDAEIFNYSSFSRLVNQYKDQPDKLREALFNLFIYLDKPIEDRGKFPLKEFKDFPYVNGGLYEKRFLSIPYFNKEITEEISKACEVNWADISPAIFGAAYEATINPVTRRRLGMHYTSVQNIHKVIDPLFLDELKAEFEKIAKMDNAGGRRTRALQKFHDKLGCLVFLDPACGSGNFLTETYEELKRLENKVIEILYGDQVIFDTNVIKVTLDNFYGIEINDFACVVARTSLWISELKMKNETQRIINASLNLLPLKRYHNIIKANALRIDWNGVILAEECNYIMGNPPFVGTKLMDDSQRKDREIIFRSNKYGKLDYVACWFKKASEYMKNTTIEGAFVSTNSICQGEQVPLLWKLLLQDGLIINFCYRTFQWDNNSKQKAHIHCIIIGFSYNNRKEKWIFDKNNRFKAEHINAYLVDASNIFIEKSQKSLCGAPEMTKGSQLIDGGFYVFSEEEKNNFIKKYPVSIPYFYEYINADSFLNNRRKKFCLCLKNCPEEVIKNCPGIYERVKEVYAYRANSKAKSTNILKERPKEFFITNIPSGDSMIFPIVSSEKRSYIPIGFIKEKTIYTNALNYVDNASIYNFGIFTSNVHMIWMKMLAGRLKSDYRYSKDLVYNTFPLPTPTHKQKLLIEKTAQAILDIRDKYSNSSLSTLYDEMLMPIELRKAHEANDKAVMDAYSFDYGISENEIVSKLLEMYQQLDK